MSHTVQDKILSGIIAALLLGLGLVLSCCSSPTRTETPVLSSGDSLSTRINGATITWALSDSTYRFEQHMPPFGMVSWERGKWWLAPGWDAAESVWFARREGAVLTDSRDDSWAYLGPLERPYAVVRGRDGVGLRNSSGSVVYYELNRRSP